MKIPKLSAEKLAKLNEIEAQAAQLLTESTGQDTPKNVLVFVDNKLIEIPASLGFRN